MKGFDEIDAVEAGEDLGVGRTAHPEAGGEIIRRQAREARDRAIEVVADLRERLQFGTGERGAHRGPLFGDAEFAGRDDDLVEREGCLGAGSEGDREQG